MDGKSIMGLLLLSAAQGSTITITADGVDETEAIAALCVLVESGFGEPADDPPGRPPSGAQGESCG